ncbi:MAG: ATP-binding protein [Parcubacteria group bacterium]|jgi:hypothetical protein
MYIERKIEPLILDYLGKREILAIVGPRQSGKTTLLKKIQGQLENSIFLNFEDRDDLELFEQDIKGFAKKYFHHKYIFIDEFQYSKNGGKLLKYLFDTFPENKIIISGSSTIDLTIHAIKYLVGRVFVFNLYQLDFEEFLRFRDGNLFKIYEENKKIVDLKNNKVGTLDVSKNINGQMNNILEEFIIWGGYPRVVLAEDMKEKEMILKNIYNTYFLRDVKDLLGLADDFRLSRLLRALSVQIGQLIAYNELGNISGYDYITLKKYINILEKTFICKTIRPFFVNKRTEIVKNPKVYFFDTGLRNYVIDDFNKLENRLDKGFLYENFIATQFIKKDMEMNFWRTKTGAEVDFVIDANNEKIPLESKSGFSSAKISKSLTSFIREYNPRCAVIANESSIEIEKKSKTQIYLLPHWIV